LGKEMPNLNVLGTVFIARSIEHKYCFNNTNNDGYDENRYYGWSQEFGRRGFGGRPFLFHFFLGFFFFAEISFGFSNF